MKSVDLFCSKCGGAGEAWVLTSEDNRRGDAELRSCYVCRGTGRATKPAAPVSQHQAQLALEMAVSAAGQFGMAKAKRVIRCCPLDEDSEKSMRAIDEIMIHGDSEWDHIHQEWGHGRMTSEMYLAGRARIIERKIVEIRQRGIDVRDLGSPLPLPTWIRRNA